MCCGICMQLNRLYKNILIVILQVSTIGVVPEGGQVREVRVLVRAYRDRVPANTPDVQCYYHAVVKWKLVGKAEERVI